MQTLFLAMALVFLAGCSSMGTYFQDRALDFVDCFKMDIGYGYGLDARAKITDFVSFGAGASYAKKFGFKGRFFGAWEDRHVGIILMAIGPLEDEVAFHPSGYMNIGEHVCTGMIVWQGVKIGVSDGHKVPLGYQTCSLLIFTINGEKTAANNGLVGMWDDRLSVFDVEIAGTAGVLGILVGFSPGEFADFILGWFGVDIAGDDTKQEKNGTSP